MFKKRMLILLLIFVLVCSLMACDKNNNVSGMNEEKNQVSNDILTNDSNDEPQSTDTEKETQTAVKEEKESFGTLNEITYRILSTRLLDASEYEVNDSSTKAYLVKMVIENGSNEIFVNSALMGFNFYNEKGDSEYGIEPFENVSKATIDSMAGPGKVIYGEYVLVVDQNTKTVTLVIEPDFMSDDALKLSFDLDQVYDDHGYASSFEGPGFETSFTDGNATYHVNKASIDMDGEKTILTLDMVVENNTSEEYNSFEIPFRLMDSLGTNSKLHSTNSNDTFAFVPANGEKTAQVTYVIKNTDEREFDLYFAPLGQNDYFDYMHISLN